MREDLLHFIWKTKKLPLGNLFSNNGEKIVIHNFGIQNHNSGPDFFNAKLEIAEQVWAGNVEMHLKSSDWYAHGHETDPAYDNVILHVVWEDDVAVFRKDKTAIPVLQLKEIISQSVLNTYKSLLQNPQKKFINCENDIPLIDSFLFNSFLERLFVERLEQKSKVITDLLEEVNNDWEQVLFAMLLKNFGSKVNGTSFLSISKSLHFSTVRKLQNNHIALESVLIGAAGLLENEEVYDEYYKQLKKEYHFQKQKFGLNTASVEKPDFFGLRPNNFPTIRLSQFSDLYHKNQNLFSKLMNASGLNDFYEIFAAQTSAYWQNHYTFAKESKFSKKVLTKNMIDLILINTVVPLKFAYSKSLGKDSSADLMVLMSAIKAEKNSIVTKFDGLTKKSKNAFQSQSKIQLYTKYCSLNHCLKCTVGNSLLSRNS